MSSTKRETHSIKAGKPRLRARWTIKPTERLHSEVGYRRNKEKSDFRRQLKEEDR